MKRIAIAFGSLVLLGCGSGTAPARIASPVADIEWRDWESSTFEEARRSGKMVLVDVGIEGCTACRWMYEDTYRNRDVVERVNAHFVAVAVDADIRPDLGARYERWGWPATIVISPNGVEVLHLRGNKRPRTFVPILDELIGRHQAGRLEAEADTAIDVPVEPATGPVADICRAAVARVDGFTRTDIAGYGPGRFQGVYGEPVFHGLYRAHAFGEEARAAHALRTLEGYGRIIDPVWGGVFVAARTADFTGPIVEKRTYHNSAALFGFATAHWTSGDEAWLERAAGIHRYMNDFMTSPAGGWYATQEDEAPNLPEGLGAGAYYELGDAERRSHGIPPIDHGVYTDLNGRMIDAYVRTYEATGGEEWLTIARTAADHLLGERQRPDGFMLQTTPTEHVVVDERMRPFEIDERAYLEPQGRFGLALLALHRVTADARYLQAAVRIADGTREALEDPEHGGFFGSAPDGTEQLLGRTKPFNENTVMARFLSWLHAYTKNDAYLEAAERTIRAIGQPERIRRRGLQLAEFAQTVQEHMHGPVEFSIVGDRDTDEARALFAASQRVYEPRKVVHYEEPGRYPDAGHPTLYVCTREACSSPITDPSTVAEVASGFARVSPEADCLSASED